ncbi:1-(5-phosphoribosyl)-5-((5-phosphoribosylamino) methylideneamino)imidazole-4-carboxamide isomerase [Martiniozyma asiatica (nom. inval.)]|nr:1-(5-phosphoribosyl)-5-((5-phosphoribosylamino) methylideneamino)imidazole-4-carboxamide isomerase [Martiniozyma asiatica]
MTKYVGCIDIHRGAVKQIVGATLSSNDDSEVTTNYTSQHSPSHYARLYKEHKVPHTHIIKLDRSAASDDAAREALAAWPGQMQVGGGISIENALDWINSGAGKVIVTSWLFPEGELDWDRLAHLSQVVGPERLVIDVSCKVVEDGWAVAINKWTTITQTLLNRDLFERLAKYCGEVLVHAADVEGLCQGIDEKLVTRLGEWCAGLPLAVVYAGGAKDVSDLARVEALSGGLVHLTYGSSCELFGGKVRFEELVAWNSRV